MAFPYSAALYPGVRPLLLNQRFCFGNRGVELLHQRVAEHELYGNAARRQLLDDLLQFALRFAIELQSGSGASCNFRPLRELGCHLHQSLSRDVRVLRPERS